jgi:hypothetical protein
MARTLLRRRSGLWQLELLLVAAIYLAYDGSRLLVSGGLDEAVRDARGLIDVEQWLHLDPERWLNTVFSGHQWLGVPADYVYATLHYLVTPAVLIWLWRHHRDQYRRARTWLGITTALALVGFILFPAAPPRLMPSSYGFTDTMAQHAAVGWWGGAASAPKGLGSMTNEFAAMPSLHMGWSLWCGLLLFRFARDRTVRTLGLLYPLMIATVVMGTGNHYLLDCVAGAVLLGVGAVLTGPALRLTDGFRASVSGRTHVRARTRSAVPAPASAPTPTPASAPVRQPALTGAAPFRQEAMRTHPSPVPECTCSPLTADGSSVTCTVRSHMSELASTP